MKMILINIVISALKRMLDKGLALQIQEFVSAAFRLDISGKEKKDLVLKELGDVGGVVSEAFAASSPWLINAFIEMLVGKDETKQQK